MATRSDRPTDGRRPEARVPSSGARRKRILLFRSIAVLGSFGLALIALEVGLWAFSEPGGGWYAAGPQRLQFLERYVRRNSDGFRDREFTPRAPEGRQRILAVGDSFTFGDGIRDVDDTWPRVLETVLNDAGRPSEVCNLGVPGANTAFERRVLSEVGPGLDPDHIVVGFVINDVEPPGADRAIVQREVFVPLLPLGGLDTTLTRVSYAYSWLRARKNGLYRRLGWSVSYTDYLHRLYDDETVWGTFRDEAESLVREARARGVPVTVVLFPYFADMPEYTFSSAHARVADVFRQSGADVVDLYELFRGRDVGELCVSPQDAHPNETAHRIAAEAIAARLLETETPSDGTRSPSAGGADGP